MRVTRITATPTQHATEHKKILGISITPDGSNPATAFVYNEADNSQTAANRKIELRVPADESKEVFFNNRPGEGLVFDAGINVVITGSAAVFIYE